jgi:hypothetical protein
MLEILSAFSVHQIIVYTIMLALAIKGGVDFFGWVKDKYESKFNKDYKAKKGEEMLEEHYDKCKLQHLESVARYEGLNKKIDDLTENINQKVGNIEAQIAQLVDSDRNDIKSWIVEKHHELMKKAWVDDFTMDTIEKRFADYLAEDGNSYVEGLVNELRALPHIPPED